MSSRQNCFQHSCTYETGITGFHKITLTVLKTLIKNQKAKVVKCRNYKSYNLVFREELRKKLSSSLIDDKKLNKFLEFSQSVLNNHESVKHKFDRTNQVIL